MRKTLIICVLTLLTMLPAAAQKFSLSGRVVEKESGEPVEFATVVVTASEQWAVTDSQGRFSIRDIPVAKSTVTVACLGYVSVTRDIVFKRDITDFKFQLAEDNLTLESAVVTAEENHAAATTSRTIDKTALDHVQLMNVSDIASLLPGGVTENNTLTSQKQFTLRAGGSGESGNASFGTAVEVDGVRLSNNASFDTAASGSVGIKGVNTNNIASANIESVEVITGVPSVEYGDMGSGVVKINTRKGKTPWQVTLSTSPNTKQISVSKGFGLGYGKSGASRGVINASAEYTQSVAQPMSPYKAYDRKQLSLTWFNLFNKGLFERFPLRLTLGVTGNLGGMNTSADPDAVQGTWAVGKDNSVRANFTLNWQLNRSWITNLELSGAVSYADKSTQERAKSDAPSNKIVLHGREEGYFMAEAFTEPVPAVTYIPPGYWYSLMYDEDRPLNTRLNLKAGWSTHIGKATSRLKLGADWTTDYNFGRGVWSPDMATAPTFREYPYSNVPVMHNVALFAEENLMIPLGSGHLNLIAGLRSDNTYIKGSAYGLTSSFSPRFNAKYTIIDPKGRGRKSVRELSVRASWGIAVKLPSFSVLFPIPTYRDDDIFTSTTNSANQSFLAYHIQPRSVEYNPALRWQRNRLAEAGVEANLWGNKISLAAFWNRSFDTYRMSARYTPGAYTYTPIESLDAVSIPVDDRAFSIDRGTGTVTVSDLRGNLPSQELAHYSRRMMLIDYYPENERSHADRYGLEWVLDFAPIKAINTKVRLDGTFYAYRYLGTNRIAYCPVSYQSAQDNQPYGYVGYYYGANSTSNGSESRTLRMNLTVSTHIPSVRLIVSAKLEASFLKYARSLSQTADGEEIARTISNTADILSTTGESIYAGDNYVVVYPQYYSTPEQPDVLRDYLADLQAARATGNNTLVTDLTSLAYKSSYVYVFAQDYYSPYFNANFSVTKEIGDLASISFYANNFFNNRGQIWSTKYRLNYPVANYIPNFYYGLTLRLKF